MESLLKPLSIKSYPAQKQRRFWGSLLVTLGFLLLTAGCGIFRCKCPKVASSAGSEQVVPADTSRSGSLSARR